MNLRVAIDIGNSNVVVGVHDGNHWIHIWRIETSATDHAFKLQITKLWLETGLGVSEIDKVILSSVVPELTGPYRAFGQGLFKCEVLVLSPEIYDRLNLGIPSPHEIGPDLVANAFAATQTLKLPCLIIDFGTALTFLVISSDRKILGASIAPGINTAMRSLYTNTARLPRVPLEIPREVAGKNTIEAIQSGIIIGYRGLIKELISEYQKWSETKLFVVATGGLSHVMTDYQEYFDVVIPTLTLDGLIAIAEAVNQ